MEDEAGFDGVCVCTGTNTWASLPCFKGQDVFKGEIMHSEKYRSAEVRTQSVHVPYETVQVLYDNSCEWVTVVVFM